MSTSRRRHVRGRGRHDGGASAVEYALIIVGVALASIVAIFALNRSVEAAYVQASDSMSGGTSSAGPVPSGTATVPSPTSSSTTAVPAPSGTTTTAAPGPSTTRTTAAPSASPTTTKPLVKKEVRQGNDETLIDLKLKNEKDLKNETTAITPDGAGSVEWDGDKLKIKVDEDAVVGSEITVTYSYQIDGVNYTGTVTVIVKPKK